MAENKRRTNFAPSEIDLLVSVVANYKNIIECKRTDAISVGKKEAAWKKVEEDFNSQNESSLFRDEKALRKKYTNLKMDLKKRAAAEKKSLYATGGGPPANHISENDDRLLSILHEKQIHGMDSQYDCDYIPHTRPLTTLKPGDVEENAAPVVIEDQEEIEWLEDDMVSFPEPVNENRCVLLEAKEEIPEPWNKYDSGMLRRAKNSKLKPNNMRIRKSNGQSSWSRLAEVKAKWTEEKLHLQIQLLKEEHQTKISLMEEKAKLERDLMKEKHELEMQILRKKLETMDDQI